MNLAMNVIDTHRYNVICEIVQRVIILDKWCDTYVAIFRGRISFCIHKEGRMLLRGKASITDSEELDRQNSELSDLIEQFEAEKNEKI